MTFFLFTAVFFVPLPAQSKTLDICFSPHGHCDQVFVSWVDASRKSLEGAIYSFTEPHIVEALIRAHRRGVKVRLVKNTPDDSKTTQSMLLRLEDAGIPIHRQPGSGGGLQHNKFLIVDGKYVLTGSFNWTRAASKRNDENLVVLDDAALRFQKEFERLWMAPD